ncbi:GNAT family N-acetyltransferase [Numidum massiliense]|uniref:GNAT family N-acetyltransferase n=1 Tax=Numidum massiliense TaxID=1522315 RepID=UPI0006D55D5C|nr:GNAT family N-acetyltransferase [Numidum massiliense]
MNWYEKLAKYFPEEEMKSKEHMERLLADKPHIYKKDVGPEHVVMYAEFPDFLFVDYLLVAKEGRSKGLGSQLIEKMKRKQKPIILEVEPIDYTDSDTVKRQRFYKRIGFHKAQLINYWPTDIETGKPYELEIHYWSPTNESEQAIYKKMKHVYNNIHTYRDKEIYGKEDKPVEEILTLDEEPPVENQIG